MTLAILPSAPRSPNAPGTRIAWHGSRLRGDVAVGMLEYFGVDPADVDLHAIGDAAMDQRFVERLVRVLQPDIFADHADGDFAFGVGQAIDDVGPAREVGLVARLDTERA